MLRFGILWKAVDTKPYSTEPDNKKTKVLVNLSKTYVSTLVRVLTGHCRFNLHMSLIYGSV